MIRFADLGIQLVGSGEDYLFFDAKTDRCVVSLSGQSQAFSFDELLLELIDEDSPIRRLRELRELLSLLPVELRTRLQIAAARLTGEDPS